MRALAGILAALGLLAVLFAATPRPGGSETEQASRDARRVADLKRVCAALAAYHRRNGNYPDTFDAWRGDMIKHGSYGYDAGGYIPELAPEFLRELPRDPDARYPNLRSGYMYRSNGQDYKLVLRGTPHHHEAEGVLRDPMRADSWQVSSAGGLHW